jgi:hypothetical protein
MVAPRDKFDGGRLPKLMRCAGGSWSKRSKWIVPGRPRLGTSISLVFRSVDSIRIAGRRSSDFAVSLFEYEADNRRLFVL